MPIFTKRSRAGTLQIISALLSKNGPMVTFASDTSLLLPHEGAGSEGVAAVCSGFCARSWFRGINCNGLFAITGLFLSTGNR